MTHEIRRRAASMDDNNANATLSLASLLYAWKFFDKF
jgi:hypothetical protein